MQIQIRSITSYEDYEALADLLSSVFNTNIPSQRLMAYGSPSLDLRRRIAILESGKVIGYSSVLNQRPDLGNVVIAIHPHYRRFGLGGLFLKEAKQFARSKQMKLLTSQVVDNDQPSLQFLLNRGFTIKEHKNEFTLQVADFDPSVFQNLSQAGFATIFLQKKDEIEVNRSRLHDLYNEIIVDAPDKFSLKPNDASTNLAIWDYETAITIIAVKEAQWVGFTTVLLDAEEGVIYHAFTGVHKNYRGRQIAQSLKLLVIQWAQEHHIKTIITHNDSTNHAMISINQKLGYQMESGYFVLAADLQTAV